MDIDRMLFLVRQPFLFSTWLQFFEGADDAAEDGEVGGEVDGGDFADAPGKPLEMLHYDVAPLTRSQSGSDTPIIESPDNHATSPMEHCNNDFIDGP